MRSLRHFLLMVSALAMLLGSTPATAFAEPNAFGHPGGDKPPACPTEHRNPVTTGPPPFDPSYYFKGDWRLGPKHLPDRPPLGAFFVDYHRLDRLTPDQFLDCYWNDDTKGWWFPDNDGFALTPNGDPIKASVQLQAGQLVDLFGSGTGHFLSPAGTPYALRAIPPSNTDAYVAEGNFNYHLYRVVKPFSVDAGPARPWFGQPGFGLQYVTGPTIPDLVAGGFLETLK